jgi:hypothetical protein
MAIGFTHLKKRFWINDLQGSSPATVGSITVAANIEKIELFPRITSLAKCIRRDV